MSRPFSIFHGHLSHEAAVALVTQAGVGSYLLAFQPRTADAFCIYHGAPLLGAASTAADTGAHGATPGVTCTARRYDINIDAQGVYSLVIADDGGEPPALSSPLQRSFKGRSVSDTVSTCISSMPQAFSIPILSKRFVAATQARVQEVVHSLVGTGVDASTAMLIGSGSNAAGMLALPDGITSAASTVTIPLPSASFPRFAAAQAPEHSSTSAARGLSFLPRTLPLPVLKVAAGMGHAVAVLAGGVACSWGKNSAGQLGIGVRGGSRSQATEVPALLGHIIIDVAAGSTHSMFLSSRGEVFVCGYNGSGSCGTGNADNLRTPVSLAYFCRKPFGRRAHATLTQVANTVVGGGVPNSYSGATTPSARDDDFVSDLMSSTFDTSAADAASVTTTRDDARSHASRSTYGSSVTSAGRTFMTTTSVVTDAASGASLASDDLAVLAAVQASRAFSLSGANLRAVGEQGGGASAGALTGPSTAAAELAKIGGISWSTSAGVVDFEAYGDDDAITTASTGVGLVGDVDGSAVLDVITNIAAGGESSFALAASGRVYAWGGSSNGQTGTGMTRDVLQPMLVQELRQSRIVQVAAGMAHTLFVSAEGELFACGKGAYGRLGQDSDERDRAVPVRVRGPLTDRSVVHAAAGEAHSVVCTAAGDVFCFGDNASFQLGVDTEVAVDEAPAAVSGLPPTGRAALLPAYHALASSTQRLLPTTRRTAVPTQVSALEGVRIAAVAAGDMHTLARAWDGTVYAWGRNKDAPVLPAVVRSQVARLTQDEPLSDDEALKVRGLDAGARDAAIAGMLPEAHTWSAQRLSSTSASVVAAVHKAACSGVLVQPTKLDTALHVQYVASCGTATFMIGTPLEAADAALACTALLASRSSCDDVVPSMPPCGHACIISCSPSSAWLLNPELDAHGDVASTVHIESLVVDMLDTQQAGHGGANGREERGMPDAGTLPSSTALNEVPLVASASDRIAQLDGTNSVVEVATHEHAAADDALARLDESSREEAVPLPQVQAAATENACLELTPNYNTAQGSLPADEACVSTLEDTSTACTTPLTEDVSEQPAGATLATAIVTTASCGATQNEQVLCADDVIPEQLFVDVDAVVPQGDVLGVVEHSKYERVVTSGETAHAAAAAAVGADSQVPNYTAIEPAAESAPAPAPAPAHVETLPLSAASVAELEWHDVKLSSMPASIPAALPTASALEIERVHMEAPLTLEKHMPPPPPVQSDGLPPASRRSGVARFLDCLLCRSTPVE